MSDNWTLEKEIKTNERDDTGNYGISFHPDSSMFAVGTQAGADGENANLRVYKTTNFTEINNSPISTFNDNVFDVSFSSDGQYLAGGGAGEIIKVFDTSNWTRVAEIQLESSAGNSQMVENLEFHPTDDILSATTDDDGVIRLYETNNFTEIDESPVNLASTYSLKSSFHPSGDYFAVSTGEIFDTSDWSLLDDSIIKNAHDVAFSKYGDYLATAHEEEDNSNAVVVRTSDWTEIPESPLITNDNVREVAFHENYLATNDTEHAELRVFDINNNWSEISQSPLQDFYSVEGWLEFAPDGSYLVKTKDSGQNIYIYNADPILEQIATAKLSINSNIIDVPLYDSEASEALNDDSLRFNTSNGIASPKLVNPTGEKLRFKHPNKGIRGIETKNE